MHICLVAHNRFHHDRKGRAAYGALTAAGHEVTVVAVDNGQARSPVATTVPNNAPMGLGRAGALIRRLKPRSWRDAGITRRLTAASIATGATTFFPTHPRSLQAAIAAARATGGVVMRTPDMTCPPDVDLITRAPAEPGLARSVGGLGVFHTPGDAREPYRPQPDRFRGKRVVMCYRKTDSNPGKYLEAALRRSGAEVRLETEAIDLDLVPPDTDLVLFVEGPYPALEVTGTTTVPTVFWAHHGEHHLFTNIRLANRYRADAVLLAHSWHLALWFPAAVHRFPFGVATELLDPAMPLAERPYDVALVGAKLWEGGPYSRRQQIVRELEAEFPPDRLSFGEKVTSEAMADMYARARVVVNEGGTRHYPITMRVLESVGSGAVLLSDPLPGTEMLLEPETEFAVLSDDVVRDVKALLDDLPRMQAMTDRALERSLGSNTYDHRVDELVEIAAGLEKRQISAPAVTDHLATVVDRDAEVQRLVQLGAPDLAEQLPTREVWGATEIHPDRLRPGNIEAVVVSDDSDQALTDRVVASARRYVYTVGQLSRVETEVRALHPDARVSQDLGITRFDLMAEAYRIMPHEVIAE
jgi:Glycosyl transferases group 1